MNSERSSKHDATQEHIPLVELSSDVIPRDALSFVTWDGLPNFYDSGSPYDNGANSRSPRNASTTASHQLYKYDEVEEQQTALNSGMEPQNTCDANIASSQQSTSTEHPETGKQNIPILDYPSNEDSTEHLIESSPLLSEDPFGLSADVLAFNSGIRGRNIRVEGMHQPNTCSIGESVRVSAGEDSLSDGVGDGEEHTPQGLPLGIRTQVTTWLPYTLRWPFLLLLSLSALTLSLAIAIISWYSSVNHGLGRDDGSSPLHFAWRFLPPLLAVLYTQLTAMLLDDVKKTEPFARLAKPGGSMATSSVLKAPGAWWNALADGLSTKNGGRRSWLLFCSACTNVMAFLAISPLSSSLLESRDVTIRRNANFTRLIPNENSPLRMSMGRDTYLRILGHTLQNVSTSAWISDSYAIVPAWPSALESAPLGPLLSSSPEVWEIETQVLDTDLVCEKMSLASRNVMHNSRATKSGQFYNHSKAERFIILSTESGCTYRFEPVLSSQVPIRGGSLWYNLSSSNTVFEHSGLHLNHSRGCDKGEILITSTPWTQAYTHFNGTLSPDFKISGQLCTSNYYMASIKITMSTSDGTSKFNFSEHEYREKRTPIPKSYLSIQELQDLVLQRSWTDYLAILPTEIHPTPTSDGLSSLLAAQYDGVSGMVDDKNIVERAKKLKQRVFGEILQHSLLRPNLSHPVIVQGYVTRNEKRVMASNGIAIALSSILFVSFGLSILVAYFSSLRRRPLNLRNDPATGAEVASFIILHEGVRPCLQDLDQSSKQTMIKVLQRKKYNTVPGMLNEMVLQGADTPEDTTSGTVLKKHRKPAVPRLRTLACLNLYLAALLVALLVMYRFAQRSMLYGSAFLYRPSIQVHNTHVSVAAPFSVVSTLLAVGVGLWWGAIDTTFRRLQPYISITKAPKGLSQGVGLSYQSSYWLWAATKSASNGHWLLFLITLGASLSPCLTISMASIFQRGQGSSTHNMAAERTLEIRTVPILDEVIMPGPLHYASRYAASQIQNNLFSQFKTNWLYEATVRLTLNGSRPAWSHDEWSFLPLDLTQFSGFEHTLKAKKHNVLETSISVTTTAIRGHIECTPYEGLDNTSTWLRHWDPAMAWKPPTDNSVTETLMSGYLLGTIHPRYSPEFTAEFFNTSFLSHDAIVRCCLNDTSSPSKGVAIGYWSRTGPWKESSNFDPLTLNMRPSNFTIKWIYGNNVMMLENDWCQPLGGDCLLFEDVPSVEALQCMPLIEMATAAVTIDRVTGMVQSYTIVDEPREATGAWDNDYVNQSHYRDDFIHDPQSDYFLNITVSYGHIFLDAMLGASDLDNFLDRHDLFRDQENLRDKTYNFRDTTRGLNLDFMTYSMYSMANEDPTALLDAPTMAKLGQKTFSTFFQHFVSNNVSMETGSWAYQKINESLPSTLGETLGSTKNGTRYKDVLHPISNTNITTDVRISASIEVLQMNSTAVWISVAILIWLIGTTLVIAAMQRRYSKNMLRDVECMADVLILVAGSDKLLQLLRQRDWEELKKDHSIRTKLGFFEGSDGRQRWGIEVVDEDA
ncbi:uncharacterized protein K452DRAFT_361940 [Aplosporella prunicola CBS 121167]|uniref:Uncharacterized protein n=1 Tax=Aplosporella prunicola CBS 121167 TaxID=1176127 RepID=A0A6A6B2H1_9PEZI|nr:uncharacterized protein K452DRAFT_361940 [Aplosporella prunicola CBS 121167]KAF2137414.1 hypothetical protein K452DRAFT_361940 [Aplosporella prunicola CBS 121167]